MDIQISPELAKIVGEEEVQFIAKWFSGSDSVSCTKAFLIPASFKPDDHGSIATSSAVIIIEHGTDREPHYGLCYIYSKGDSPTVRSHSEAPHISPLYDLDLNIGSHRVLVAEVLEKQAIPR